MTRNTPSLRKVSSCSALVNAREADAIPRYGKVQTSALEIFPSGQTGWEV